MKTNPVTEGSSSSIDTSSKIGQETTDQAKKGCFTAFTDRLEESVAILETTGKDCCIPWKAIGKLIAYTFITGIATIAGSLAAFANNSFYAAKAFITGNSYKDEAISAHEFGRKIYELVYGKSKKDPTTDEPAIISENPPIDSSERKL
jgi:hypothetical protein